MGVERELALRLAWYMTNFGPIPTKDVVRLFRVASGLSTDHSDDELRRLAREILDNFEHLDH